MAGRRRRWRAGCPRCTRGSSRGRSRRGRTEGRRRSSPRDAPTRRRRPPPVGNPRGADGGGDAPGLLEARGEGRDAAGIDTAGMSRGGEGSPRQRRGRGRRHASRATRVVAPAEKDWSTTSATADDDDEEPHCSRRRGRRSTMGAVVPDGRDRFPVSQRTLDLKTESAYFRVRLCVPRPRAPCVRPTNQPSAHPPVPASRYPFAASLSGPRDRRARPPSPRRSRTRSPRPTASSGARYPSTTSRSSPTRSGQNGGEDEMGQLWMRGRRALPRERRAKGADRAGDADDDAGRDGMSRERARRVEIVGRPRRRVRGEGPGDSIDCASVVA